MNKKFIVFVVILVIAVVVATFNYKTITGWLGLNKNTETVDLIENTPETVDETANSDIVVAENNNP